MALARLEDMKLRTKLGYRKVYSPEVRALTVVNHGVLGQPTTRRRGARHAELPRLARRGRGRRPPVPQPGRRLAAPPRATTSAPPLVREHRAHRDRPLGARACRTPSTPSSKLALAQHARERAGATRRSSRRSTATGWSSRASATRRAARRAVRADTGQGRREDLPGRPRRRVPGSDLQLQPHAPLDRTRLVPRLVLYLDGEPVAFWQGTRTAARSSSACPATIPRRPPAGRQLVLIRLIEGSAGTRAVDTLDYGFGEAEYKRRFGTRSWLEEECSCTPRRRRASG